MKEIKDHDYCLRCGRKLKNPIARQRGYGIVCERKLKLEKTHQLFNTQKEKPPEWVAFNNYLIY